MINFRLEVIVVIFFLLIFFFFWGGGGMREAIATCPCVSGQIGHNYMRIDNPRVRSELHAGPGIVRRTRMFVRND